MSHFAALTLCVIALIPAAVRSQVPAAGPLAAHVQQLQAADTITRSRAAKALGALGDAARPAVPALVHALGDRDPFVARDVTEALGKVGKCAVPELLTALHNANCKVRYRATVALSHIKPKDPEALQALVRAL